MGNCGRNGKEGMEIVCPGGIRATLELVSSMLDGEFLSWGSVFLAPSTVPYTLVKSIRGRILT